MIERIDLGDIRILVSDLFLSYVVTNREPAILKICCGSVVI